MKKSLSLISLLAASAANMYGGCDVSGNTFYAVRPGFHSARPERVSLWRGMDAKADENGWHGSFQLVPYAGQSTRAKQLAQYFMFEGKDELVFAGQYAFGAGALANNPYLRDVNVAHFNLPEAFSSKVKFRPKQTFIAGGLAWRQYLEGFCRNSRVWFELSSPIEYIRNDMKLKEEIIHPDPAAQEGTPPSVYRNSSVTEAFTGVKPYYNETVGKVTGQGWNYGRIDGVHSKTRLSDIEIKFGYDWCVCENAFLDGYIGMVAPAGNRAKGVNVFEPIVGDQSFGAMWGGSFGMDFYCCNDRTLRLELESNARYLFRRGQVRSFDVYDKPWSRYMLVYQNVTDAAVGSVTEGINVFTQELNVTPRFSASINGALVWKTCNMECEVGLNLWARQSERVSLKNPWVAGPTFVAIGALTGRPVTGSVSPAIEIGEDFSGANVAVTSANYANFAIQESDLNLSSAASPAALSNLIYAAHGYHFDGCKHPMLLGLGASYEFSSFNSALSRWMVWGKFGVSF